MYLLTDVPVALVQPTILRCAARAPHRNTSARVGVLRNLQPTLIGLHATNDLPTSSLLRIMPTLPLPRAQCAVEQRALHRLVRQPLQLLLCHFRAVLHHLAQLTRLARIGRAAPLHLHQGACLVELLSCTNHASVSQATSWQASRARAPATHVPGVLRGDEHTGSAVLVFCMQR